MIEPKRPDVLRVMGWTECTKIESYIDHLEARIKELEAENDKLDDRAIDANAALYNLRAENQRLREALEIITGTRPCLDDLMSDKDVARAALKEEA